MCFFLRSLTGPLSCFGSWRQKSLFSFVFLPIFLSLFYFAVTVVPFQFYDSLSQEVCSFLPFWSLLQNSIQLVILKPSVPGVLPAALSDLDKSFTLHKLSWMQQVWGVVVFVFWLPVLTDMLKICFEERILLAQG